MTIQFFDNAVVLKPRKLSYIATWIPTSFMFLLTVIMLLTGGHKTMSLISSIVWSVILLGAVYYSVMILKFQHRLGRGVWVSWDCWSSYWRKTSVPIESIVSIQLGTDFYLRPFAAVLVRYRKGPQEKMFCVPLEAFPLKDLQQFIDVFGKLRPDLKMPSVRN
ncbi:hypothetical protein [Brevundimonas nasdae]|uniref:hypothetical protein n=1 Tax=Brevundimonas nasdae TaxID=172043 RepID=UPI003F68CF7A